MSARRTHDEYTVAWICALPKEFTAATAMLDQRHDKLPKPPNDHNTYNLGSVGQHNIVITCLPKGVIGTAAAAAVVVRLINTFQSIKFGFMIGIGGGIPPKVRLGDVVVSTPDGDYSGVVQWDMGRAIGGEGGFEATGALNNPPISILTALSNLETEHSLSGSKVLEYLEQLGKKWPKVASKYSKPQLLEDLLFKSDYDHVMQATADVEMDMEGSQDEEGSEDEDANCQFCDRTKLVKRKPRGMKIHYGLIASGNQVIKDAAFRDTVNKRLGGRVLCFEMEAAGILNEIPCIVIRGICDYADSHKNKGWQEYAAGLAAGFAKELLGYLQPGDVEMERPARELRKQREKIERINFVVPFNIPFPRNPNFTGRAEELGKIHERFASPVHGNAPSMFALTGTGGMGKTQIAVEYAYRYDRDYTAVFWVSAASKQSIETSFVDIMQLIIREQARIAWPESVPDYEIVGRKLGIPGQIDSEGTISANPETICVIQSAFLCWLQLPGNNKWLLLFDNADDLETFDIQNYFPKHGGGAILITSRRPHFSQTAEQVDLDGLDSKSAVKLLLSLAGLRDARIDAQSEAIKLVERLGLMPLAISHAGHYIHETKIPLEDYLRGYETFITQAGKPKFGWNYRDDTAKTTWEISFSQIEKQDIEAAKLLLTCSYLNPEEIFESLWEDEQFDKAKIKGRILLLASYSLVKIIRFGVFSIHPIVHSWARERLQQADRLSPIKYAIMILGEASGRENMLRDSSKWESREERRIASHLEHLHRYSKLCFSRFRLHEEQGYESQMLVDHINDIALVFDHQGKYDDAMQWYERALAGKEKVLGKDHSSTLDIVNSIAVVFSKQAKYDKAMQWHERALTGKEKVLGKGHLLTLNIVNNIAVVFNNQSKYNEAMQWYERALAGYKKILGENDPSILLIVHNIAAVFKEQGKYDEAMQWYERALAGKEKILGKGHPSTLSTVHNIATVFNSQGKYNEAMRWYERALAGSEKALGKGHPSTLSTVHNVATALEAQGKHDEAMQWYERALAGKEKVLGKDHPSTLDTVNNIAGIVKRRDGYNEAMKWYERALTGREKILGKDHPLTLDTINNIAGIFNSQDKYNEAMKWYERALIGYEKVLGKDHPSTLQTVNNIGEVFKNQSKYNEAMQWCERALIGREKFLGKDHPSTLSTVNKIATIFYTQGKYDEAQQWYERALAGYEKVLGKDHPSTLIIAECLRLLIAEIASSNRKYLTRGNWKNWLRKLGKNGGSKVR
ncbi:hypothetical protein TWF718_000450 [Orbilia javanica]|uniref:Nucleoside phosphorylase domain-containing protein n=1 Tax=Orbilia javanica TaxID=47235 RepID=A0AAN8MZC6_9PEZI